MRLQILTVFAVTFLVGCTTSNGGGPNAVYDAGASIGTATFGGAVVAVTAGVGRSTLPDGGPALELSVRGVKIGPGDPQFYCDAYFPGVALDAGSFTIGDVASFLAVIYTSESSADAWGNASGFELTITSPGPGFSGLNSLYLGAYEVRYHLGDQAEIWPFPSGSFTATLAPLDSTDGGTTVSVTFAPPPN